MAAAPAANPSAHPDASTPRTEELRLALVLNGGVSLAVWMGGVSFELNRLVRETHPVYKGLLELTGTAARIDVISGTSAGGINGAALALAQIHDQSLYGLRDVWLETAGLDRLLRDPEEPDPSSLLRGDDWFLPEIRRAFAELCKSTPAAPAQVPMLLSLTSTLFDGVSQTQLDDFGAVIEDTVHRALWRFERMEGTADEFARPRIVDQLAFAARATASFPVAFEPAHFDPADEVFGDDRPLRARLSPDQKIETQTLLLDGGILDNRPFDAALEGIARLPAQGNTRRVLAYVVPDPAAQAERRVPDKATGKLPKPTLAQVTWRSLVSIPASQSIAGHMARLRDHNDEASNRWARLVGAVRHVGARRLMDNAATMLPAYRTRRIDGVIDYLIAETETGLAASRAGAPGGAGSDDTEVAMRRATRQWLRCTWRSADLPHVWAGRIPDAYRPFEALVSGDAARWDWGMYPLEFMAELTIEVLRRTQRLHGLVERWSQQPGDEVDGPPIAQPVTAGTAPNPGWERRDAGPSAVGQALRGAASRIGDRQLEPVWTALYKTVQTLRTRRMRATREVEDTGREHFRALVAAWTASGGEQPPQVDAIRMIEALLRTSNAQTDAVDEGRNLRVARELCGLMAALREPIEQILERHERQAFRLRTDIEEAVADLAALHRYFFEIAPGDAPLEIDRIAWRMLALEVFELSAATRQRTPDAQAELVQISARLHSAWGGRDEPSRKLNGMQLAHFGAFYKRSWRANDWTFGRLDGIDRAIRIALNPDALQRRFGLRQVRAGAGGPLFPRSSDYVLQYLRALAVDSAEPALREILADHWQRDEARIRVELQWLDQPATLPPPVLEACATALTRRLQLEALRQELPEIALSLIAERQSGAPPSELAGVPLLARVAPDGRPAVPSPENAVALVRSDLLGAETLALQPGSDLFTRTTSQALATTHAAMGAKTSGLNAIHVLFRITEWPVRILYWLANRLSGASASGAAMEGAVLGIGLALVAAGLLTDKLPSAALGLGWAMLAGVVAVTLLRNIRGGWLLVALIFLGLYLIKALLFWQIVAAALGVVLLLQPWSAPIAMGSLVLVAAWWSAGASFDALRQLWQDLAPAAWVPQAWDPPLAAEAPAALAKLKLALGPALLIVALVVVSALSRTLRRRGAGPRPVKRP
ncbi:patatin-like protein [Variovorax sp. J22P168]|uniref:patatin-like protein n=1 Tax=Variovorax jilinensis TaxID=3053513 RepID=UPI002574E2D0|nr:patatin-like protein [Variovorax sp. J22P168]MDM0014405.1 patatin-like protein [Variovorax sp. J22P168]